MDDLIAFLRARLDERAAKAKAAAREAGEPAWSAGNEYLSESVHTAETGAAVAYGPYGGLSWEMRQYLAENDPRFVLADVAAKRQIINRAEELWEGNTLLTPAGDALGELQDVVLPALALPYADHPDYREEWRP